MRCENHQVEVSDVSSFGDRERNQHAVARRTAEAKNKRDIIRCLKRYVIREVYDLIKTNPRTGEIAT